jgi:hypothetical protein
VKEQETIFFHIFYRRPPTDCVLKCDNITLLKRAHCLLSKSHICVLGLGNLLRYLQVDVVTIGGENTSVSGDTYGGVGFYALSISHKQPSTERHGRCQYWTPFVDSTCIFGLADQWASVRRIAPALFNRIARYEVEFGKTIHKGKSVLDLANKGTPYPECGNEELVALAMGRDYPTQLALTADWTMPAGAFRHCGGPT